MTKICVAYLRIACASSGGVIMEVVRAHEEEELMS